MGIKRGIIQARGLGDILIALPIARHYHDAGDEIIWPVCDEFMGSLESAVPWVTWIGIPTDDRGRFFIDEPVRIFAEQGVDLDQALYLYHYLNTQPQMTDPELFNILKFDQYKYQVAGVPFRDKWTLSSCITRDPIRERELRDRLKLTDRYAVVHQTGSTVKTAVDLSWLDPAVQIINVEDHMTDSVWDWIGVLEGAEAVVCIDSVIANMVDQLCIAGPDLYWMRRSPWDLTPVMGSHWTVVPTSLPIAEPKRVDPAVEAKRLMDRMAELNRPQPRVDAPAPRREASGVTSHVPFQAKGAIPTSFMSAVKNGGASGNAPLGQPAPKNAATGLLANLGK